MAVSEVPIVNYREDLAGSMDFAASEEIRNNLKYVTKSKSNQIRTFAGLLFREALEIKDYFGSLEEEQLEDRELEESTYCEDPKYKQSASERLKEIRNIQTIMESESSEDEENGLDSEQLIQLHSQPRVEAPYNFFNASTTKIVQFEGYYLVNPQFPFLKQLATDNRRSGLGWARSICMKDLHIEGRKLTRISKHSGEAVAFTRSVTLSKFSNKWCVRIRRMKENISFGFGQITNPSSCPHIYFCIDSQLKCHTNNKEQFGTGLKYKQGDVILIETYFIKPRLTVQISVMWSDQQLRWKITSPSEYLRFFVSMQDVGDCVELQTAPPQQDS